MEEVTKVEKIDGAASELSDVLDTERCETCKYWKELDSQNLADGEGNCKRYPPILDLTEAHKWEPDMNVMGAGYSYLDYRFWNFPVTEAC